MSPRAEHEHCTVCGVELFALSSVDSGVCISCRDPGALEAAEALGGKVAFWSLVDVMLREPAGKKP